MVTGTRQSNDSQYNVSAAMYVLALSSLSTNCSKFGTGDSGIGCVSSSPVGSGITEVINSSRMDQ